MVAHITLISIDLNVAENLLTRHGAFADKGLSTTTHFGMRRLDRVSCAQHISVQCSVQWSVLECDVPVPGIFSFFWWYRYREFFIFWWYQNRYRNRLVPEKSLGTGIGKI